MNKGLWDLRRQTINVPSFIKPYKSGINPKAQAPLWSPSRFLQVPLSAENKPSYWILIQFSPSFFIALPHRLPPGRNDYDCFCHNFFVFSARNPPVGVLHRARTKWRSLARRLNFSLPTVWRFGNRRRRKNAQDDIAFFIDSIKIVFLVMTIYRADKRLLSVPSWGRFCLLRKNEWIRCGFWGENVPVRNGLPEFILVGKLLYFCTFFTEIEGSDAIIY